MLFITPLWNEKCSRFGATLLYFYFYSILEEKIEFYVGDALKKESIVKSSIHYWFYIIIGYQLVKWFISMD